MFNEARNRIGSVFKRKPNLEEKIYALQRELAAIGELKDMLRTPGWQRLSARLNEMIKSFDEKIVALSGDIDKNRVEINAAYALRITYAGFLNIVEGTIAREEPIKREMKEKIEFYDDTREQHSLTQLQNAEG